MKQAARGAAALGALALGAGVAFAMSGSGSQDGQSNHERVAQGGRRVRPPARPNPQARPGALAIGSAVAPFALKDAGGVETSVKWDAGDSKATVLVFVSTKCPVSNAYNARLAALGDELKAKGIPMFGLDANASEAPAQIKAHAEAHKWSFPVLHDEGNAVADKLEASVTPEAYVVDRAGKLVYWGRIDDSQDAGAIQSRDLQDAIAAVVEGKPVANAKTAAFGCGIKRAK